MTLDEIIRESKRLPRAEISELVDLLSLELSSDAETDAAWASEANRRLTDLDSGHVEGVPGTEVSAEIRRLVEQ